MTNQHTDPREITEAEIWKDIAGYEGLYQVSNTGKVRSVDRVVSHKKSGSRFCKGIELVICLNPSGYPIVGLMRGNQKATARVHRLVADAFLDNPTDLPEVNHINEDKTNNNVSNLEWCDRQHNAEHSRSKWHVFNDPDGLEVHIFNLHKFCRENNLTQSLMSHVHNGTREQYKGWTKWTPKI